MNLARLRSVLSAAAIVLALAGCRDQPLPTADAGGGLAARLVSVEAAGRYVVVFAAPRVPAGFTAHVSRLGGAVEASLDPIGVVVVTGLTAAAAAELAGAPGIAFVESDVFAEPGGTGAVPVAAVEPVAVAAELDAPTAAQFYARQWNMRAVSADVAWETGHLGSRDVVVAILDGGIDYLHPDLAGLVDLARSRSFAPEDDPILAERFPDRLPFADLHGHGTAVASIVASNGVLVAGVNQEITLLAVKVFNWTNSGSPYARWLTGIVYAADQGADVINLSGSPTFDRSENPGIVAATERAVNYAFAKGTLLITIAHNDGADLDHNGDLVRLPCEAANALCVSATGPTAAAGVNGPWENVDAPAPYTAFGRSAVDVAAPGGSIDAGTPPTLPQNQFRRIWVPCTTTPNEHSVPACQAGQPIAQPFGTSFAAPHVTGLAALLVAQLGRGNPALIRARILQSADDLGEPGTDPFYGKGRINVARALGLID